MIIQKINRKKTIRANSQILSAEMKELEERMWEKNRFCKCGADCLMECTCSKEKKDRYMKRLKRKRNEELGHKGAKILMAAQDTQGFSL